MKKFDIAPQLPRGNANVTEIHASVGHALTSWENLETRLALVFSFLMGTTDPMRSYQASMIYSAARSSSARADLMKAAADAYFSTDPAPINDLKALLTTIKQARSRRNDIAHAQIVRRSLNGELVGHFLEPPMHVLNKHPKGNAAYSFTAEQVQDYALGFEALTNDVMVMLMRFREPDYYKRLIENGA